MKSMSIHNSRSNQQGLTLIEVLVVAPLIVLLLGVFIGFMVSLTGDGLFRRETNNVTYETNAALEQIETDIGRSQGFLKTTGAVPSPQGSDNSSTQAFTVTPGASPDYKSTGPIILKSVATTKSPLNPERKLAYKNTPDASCAAATIGSNDVYPVTYIYFVKNNTLWKRTIVGPGTACASTTPWQQPSCASPYTASLCKAEDERILDDVDSINVQYFEKAGSSAATDEVDKAQSLKIDIVSNKKIAGKQISYTAGSKATLASASLSIASGGGGTTPPADPETFNYTGSAQTWAVPTGTSSVQIECWGAEGGSGFANSSTIYGGYGGYAKGILSVSSGETLNIYVGGKGANANAGASFNGGGSDDNDTYGVSYQGSGGGGASDVRQGGTALGNRRIVAGGGGGAADGGSSKPNQRMGGAGGGASGGNTVDSSSGTAAINATGGTQTAGGSGGAWSSSYGRGNNGSLGSGGSSTTTNPSGGGGGGYYGGGASTWISGGGGSGYIGGVTGGTMTSGTNTGNGKVVITPL